MISFLFVYLLFANKNQPLFLMAQYGLFKTKSKNTVFVRPKRKNEKDVRSVRAVGISENCFDQTCNTGFDTM